ncbi:hypothetical protein [Bradyrhizobium sp. WSM471]|uniref:hypothetical protein n=1 Tax=Bradyrhizobium sp. WSM471 TaxID=319017 RepID=UPI00024D196F|nr:MULTISPECIES: hypothetical protein [Bradyrhizobium]EHQ99995.1 hypothetical protein Bra471DRAFT_00533 [Bradyrhizobium sp. WSM471]UFW42129.1 hypothetical protein BcanWSM471_02630 [Bradyrhizobium canariense]
MLNFIEVFDVMQVEPSTGTSVWTGLTGTRTALRRDGHMIDPKAMAYCPIEWLDERGYLDAERARRHPRPSSI